MSDYNAGPYYRSPHSLPLRIFLRLQVDDEINNMPRKKHSSEILHYRLMERASKLQEWRQKHESTSDIKEEIREDNITTIII